MLLATAKRYWQVEALLALMGQRRVEERLRSFFELMAESYGQPCDQGVASACGSPIKISPTCWAPRGSP